MAKQRLVETAIWQDGWFYRLSIDAKLFFLFILTNPLTRESGFLELQDDLIIPQLFALNRIRKARLEIGEKIEYDAKYNLYLIKNFYKKNCKSKTMVKGALNDLTRFEKSYLIRMFLEINQHIQEFKEFEVSPTRTPPPPPGVGRIERERDNDIDIENDNNKKEDIINISIPGLDFEKLWKLYPRKTDKSDALDRFKRSIKTQEDYNNLEKAIINYDTHQKNLGTELKFIKHFATFLNKDRWKEWVNFTKQDSLREQGIGQIRDDFKLPEELDNDQIQF